MSVSAVVNTWNEEKNIKRCLDSVINWVDEVIVVDMNSTDDTVQIAQKLGAKVFSHPSVGFVEPARNFAIEKATSDWILILDADEEITSVLTSKIQSLITNNHDKSFFRIPRKNILFGKWIKTARWWPDLQIRLFKKGSVTWLNEIHSIPVTEGIGVDFEVNPENAIIHHNYNSLSQYILRMDRYTSVQAKELKEEGHEFKVSDLINKPFNEFLSRYLASEGYKDGLHGFVVSVLQAISEFILYLKVWEYSKFTETGFNLQDFDKESNKLKDDLNYWVKNEIIKNEKNSLSKFVKKVIT